MNRRWQLPVLILACALASGSCRQRKSGVETPASGGDSGAETPPAQLPKKAASGPYDCTLMAGEREFVVERCEIAPSQGIIVSGPGVALSGILEPRDYGHALEGKVRIEENENTFTADVFRQGAGNLATIFSAGANTDNLWRLSMVPSREPPAPATTR